MISPVPNRASRESKRPVKGLLVAVALLGLAIVAGVVFVGRNVWHSDPRTPLPDKRAPLAVAAEANKPSKTEKDAAKTSAQKPTKGDGLFRLGVYDQYLDEICPRLTAEEEDKLVAESGGDPNVLVGLVFARSKRGEKWLREALQKAPDNPLVHYAILSRTYPGFDRLSSALELARLAPQDASPLQAAALELLKQGNQEGAIATLREAAGRDRSSTLYSKSIESALNAYELAGRSENDARARVLLEGPGRFEGATILALGERLGFRKAGRVEDISGKEEAAALVLDACQNGLSSGGLDLHAYREYRGNELEYLRAFLRSGANAADRSIIEKYFSGSLADTFNRAKAEWAEVSDVLLFSADKPGIYKRLTPEQKTELIERIAKDGEVSAYQWAYRTRRDIFRSPDFVPQGWPADGWKALITSPGRIPIQ